MRISIIILLFFLTATSIHAQFAFLYSSAGQEYGKANCTDSDTNYIEAALFQNTINVNPTGTTNLTSRGMVDVALAKYSKRGDLLWGKRFGGTTTTEGPHGVGTDKQGNIYITGYFGNPALSGQTVDFNPNGGGTLTTKGGYDAFLAKYDKNGNYLWAIGLGNTSGNTEERAWDIYVDSSGNSYIGGGFSGTVDFNPLGAVSNIKSVQSGVGLFLAKYNSTGINQWAVAIDAKDTSVFYEAYTALDIDKNGNVYLAGNFRGANVNFDPSGTALLSSTGQTDMFLAKYTTDGGFLWAKRIGGSLQDIVSPGAMRLEKNGFPYLTGRISGTVNFNTSGGTNNVSGASLFLASYDISGAMRIAFGMTSNSGDGGHRVAFDSENNVYIAGWMNGTVDFDPSNGTYNVTAKSPTADAFLAKYTNDGKIVWANSFGTANSTENNIAAGLTIDKENNPTITGQLYGTNADFDPSPVSQLILSSVGQNDCFIAKYDSSGKLWRGTTSAGEQKISNLDSYYLKQNFPNPFNPSTKIEYNLPFEAFVTLELFSISGEKIAALIKNRQYLGLYSINFNAGDYGISSGIYLYRLIAQDVNSYEIFTQSKKMVFLK